MSIQTAPDKRSRILEAATTVFANTGFHASRVQDIAEQAGVAKGTIYLYFRNKEEILLSIFQSYFDALLDLIDSFQQAQMTAEQIIDALVQQQVKNAIVNPKILQLLGRRPLPAETAGGGRIEAYHRHVLDRLSSFLAEGIRLGQVRSFTPRIGANILYSIILSIPQHLAFYPEDSLERSFPKLVEEVACFAWAGVRKEES
ncbi:TetR/AcrR family transcriptional regulator [Candidatus Bipolaricaulota bacterium]|nr:TetR/AcrR family transcriptional regulator [Candidatus Bipolaricaulota bacterium]